MCGSQLTPTGGEKVRFHFLPFPQEGTHTPLNLTPAAAASRPGVSDRPHWLPPPPHGPGPGILSPGRGLRYGSLGSGTLAPRVPGIQAVRQPLTLEREASRPAGAQGPAAAAAAARSSWVSSLPPPALRRLLLGRRGALARPGPGRASWGGGRQGCRRALRRLCRRPGSQLCGLRPRGSLDHLPTPLLPASSPLPSPARPGRRKPGLHLPARRVRPAPGLAQTPAARLSASGHTLQLLSGLAPSLPASPRIPGRTSALPPLYPPPLLFPTHPPSLRSRLWGWARDVKPSVGVGETGRRGPSKEQRPLSQLPTVSPGTGADRLGIKC